MNILPKSHAFKAVLMLCLTVFLSACGGGSSSSGGPPAPVLPPLTLFATGLYNGTLNATVGGQNTIAGDSDPGPITLEVQGGVAGSQQVRIAFAQFSGTSAIGPDGEFSIPSGSFPLRVTNRNGRAIATCLGELLFEGTFADNAVSGNVTTTTEFACDDTRFGPLSLTGTFEASLGAAKLAGFGRPITVMAVDQ